MPTPKMPQKEQDAYDDALKQIETCGREASAKLNLNILGLTCLPPEIGQLAHLSELWLSDNQLGTPLSNAGYSAVVFPRAFAAHLGLR